MVVEKRRGHIPYIEGFQSVTVRVGSTPSADGETAIATTNVICGVFNYDSALTATMDCSPPLCGRYVSLEKAGARFEFADVYLNDCGLGPC